MQGIIPQANLGFALSGEEMQNLEKLDKKKRLQVLDLTSFFCQFFGQKSRRDVIIPWNRKSHG